MVPILSYTKDQVGKEDLIDLHVRGSSSKEHIDTNTKMLLILAHGTTLYTWTMFETVENRRRQNNISASDTTFKNIGQIHSRLFQQDDSTLFFLQNNSCIREGSEHVETVTQKVKKIKIDQSFAILSDVFKHNCHKEHIVSINIDQIRQYLLIISKMQTGIDEQDIQSNLKILKFDSQNDNAC